MQGDQPLVSVIMPTFNRADFIEESLKCLLNQSYIHWECIIIDDGSTDHTKEIVASYVENDNRFSYHYKNNEGAAVARNIAVSFSKGGYILPLDSDDIIHATYIEKGIEVFKKMPHLKLVYGKAEKFGNENGAWNVPPFKYSLFLIYNMVYNSSIFKRSDFDKVGGYTADNKFEDWDLWLKLINSDKDVYQIQEVMYYYRTHKGDSITTMLDKDKEMYLCSMNDLFKNHIDKYFEYIGNPIDIERERRRLNSLVKTADYKAAVRILKHPLFKFLRNVRTKFKGLFYGK